jgi:hypothetical protein
VAHALRKMVEQRLLLCEDYDGELNRLTTLGATTGGLQMDNSGAPRVPPPPHSCRNQDDDDDDDQ